MAADDHGLPGRKAQLKAAQGRRLRSSVLRPGQGRQLILRKIG
jgi:hypothetical protein